MILRGSVPIYNLISSIYPNLNINNLSQEIEIDIIQYLFNFIFIDFIILIIHLLFKTYKFSINKI